MKEVALITGASTGIGKEFCKIHAQQGRDLIVVARREIELQELKRSLESKYKINVLIIAKDLSLENSPKEIYNEIKKSGIQIDYLINNAGFGGIGKFHERQWKEDHSMIMVNIMALTELTRLFLPDFVTRNKGRILNVSSSAAFLPGPLQAVYYASKAYVTSFSNALSEELHDTNITVTVLIPGGVDTEFSKTSGMDKTEAFKNGFGFTAETVAKEGYKAMLNGKREIISAKFSQKITFKLIPFLPKSMLIKSVRKMHQS